VQEALVAILPPVRLILLDPAVAVAVPPQLFVNPLGVATTSPVGNVSVNATPDSATVLAAGLVMVKVSVLVPFTVIVVGLNAFAIEGGATTVMLAEAVFPVPPSVDVTLPLVLFCVPAAMPFTFRLKVQDAVGARVAPERLITLVFCVAVIVPPPQLPLSPLGVEIIRPAGKVSLNPIPVSVVDVFGLLMVKLRLVEPFNGMLPVPNALLMLGGATTVIEALAVLPVPPSVELTVTLLVFAPAVVPVTFADTMQDAPGARLPPDKDTEDDPLTAVAVPPQLLVRLAGKATTRPAGRLSVNATPFSVRFWFVLLTVKVRVVVPFRGMVGAPKALAMVGGLMTVMFADDVLPFPASVERI